MNIGIIIGRIGGVDGVALETEKWIDVLHKMGHKTFLISGQYQERAMDPNRETLAPEMSFFSPESYWGQKKAFFFPDSNPEELIEHIHFYARVISEKIIKWVYEKKIDIMISENASALPAHLEMGLAIKIAAEKTSIPVITHDHDFAWERGDRYVSPHKSINDFVAETFPLRLPNSVHAVINLHGKSTIEKRFDRKAIVVPNVMDFNEPYGVRNAKSNQLKHNLGVQENSKLLFQITRIVRRKGIETAINLVHKLHDENIKLIITGSHADDEGSVYYNELNELINNLKVNRQVIFASHIINNKGLRGGGDISFSLSDAYANATACTYFSTYEGFGNAFVEAILAKRPIFVNNYKPVYWPDIGSKGFKAVMLEENVLTDESVKQMSEVIYNENLNKEIAEYNFELGKKHFSYEVLEERLTELIQETDKL